MFGAGLGGSSGVISAATGGNSGGQSARPNPTSAGLGGGFGVFSHTNCDEVKPSSTSGSSSQSLPAPSERKVSSGQATVVFACF